MVLKGLLLAVLLLIGSGLAAPAVAHKDHDRKQAEAVAARQAADRSMAHPMSPEVHEAVKDDLVRLEVEAARPWHLRLIDWIGRVHPFAVHFPLALFPVAWIALILARRRGAEESLNRAIIIVAGISSALAGLLGWLNAGFALSDSDPILLWHRWAGTGLGVAGAMIAAWSWRDGSAAHSRSMAWVLGLATLILLAQGWLGGALIHGIDHMNW